MSERFDLQEPIGRGAMGVVWRARDTTTGGTVAVKLLRGLHADDPEYVARFAREVELARRVHSPHVVRVLGYGARQGIPYVVLEYVPGSSLRARLAQHGPYAPPDARSILGQVAQGLSAVHQAGVVHRDVKASNVLVTDDGVAKLTDFGIARAPDASGQTGIGTLLGTPAYMAPEGPRDMRSDLYSLGVLYYELLAGALPFAGTSYQEVILAHVREQPDLTRIPLGERDLAGWLLAKDPDARPQDAAALLATLAGQSPASPPKRYASAAAARTARHVPRSVAAPAPPAAMPAAPGARAGARSSAGPIVAVGVLALAAVVGAVAMAVQVPARAPVGSGQTSAHPGMVIVILIALATVAAGAIAATAGLAHRRATGHRQRPSVVPPKRAP